MFVCLFVFSFESFGSGSFGGPLGGPWVLVVLWGSGGFWWSSGGPVGKSHNCHVIIFKMS